jgi:hypothetical protein
MFRQWLQNMTPIKVRPSQATRRARPRRAPKKKSYLNVENLEDRLVPSAFQPTYESVHLNGLLRNAPTTTLTPGQVSQAYQFNRISFGGVAGDGSGQTIAIVDAYDDPTIVGDLQAFDAQFGLAAPPSFQVVAQDGSNNLPGTDPAGAGNPNGNWEGEEALDVEWAHAMAPAASILLVETTDADHLFTGVDFARKQPGVSVVSMSFGAPENPFLDIVNSLFLTTPAGHPGVTFVASSGDNAVIQFPSASPNVLAVGGTNLSVDASNNWAGETAWNLSGGGESQFEPLPSWQQFLQFGPSPDRRFTPDVAYDAGTGVFTYDSYNGGSGNPWFSVKGTSVGAPQWSALIAIADQGLALAGLGPLDGVSQTLPLIYQLTHSLDFHDITSGTTVNGLSAGPGWDEVTGWGTPLANRIAAHLVYGPVDQPPVANDDTYSVPANAPFVVNAANGVLANDTDLENDPLTAQWLNAPAHGTLSFQGDGSFAYVPNPGFFGQDSFTYLAEDVDGISNVATVTLNVSQQVNLQDSVLTVSGDQLGLNYNDVITLDTTAQGGVLVNLNGQLFQYAPGIVTAVNVNGGGGNDTVNVESIPLGVAVTVTLGSGNDAVNVCPTGQNLDAIQGGLTIHGGRLSTLTANDQANPNNQLTQDFLTATTLTRIGETYDSSTGSLFFFDASISFDGLAQVTLNTGGVSNSVFIESTAFGTTTSVNADPDNVLIDVSAQAENLDNLQGPLVVYGNGADALVVNDQANPNNVLTLDTLTATSLTRLAENIDPSGFFGFHDASIDFNNLAQVTFNTGGLSNLVYVESTSTATTVNADAFNVFIDVSSAAENLDTLEGALTVHGNGSDLLVINDQNNPNNLLTQNFLTATSLTRLGETIDPILGIVVHGASINFDSLPQVIFNTGGAADLVFVQSTAAGTTTSINGAVSDTVTVGGTTDGVGDIQGPLNITNNAAAGDYTALIFDDSAYNRGYWISTLNQNSLTTNYRTDNGSQVSVAPINFVQSDLSSLSIFLGNSPGGSGNIVYVSNTPTSGYSAGLMTTITSGFAAGANDVIFVGATTGPLTVNLNNNGVTPASGVLLGGGVHTLDNLRGAITVNTLSGYTDIGLDDSANPIGQTYTMTAGTIAFRPSLPVVTFQVTNEVFLYGGSGVNTINVESTSAATVVNAGLSGKDTINLGNSSNSLSGISGNYLSVQIDKPGNRLVLNDQGDPVTRNYSLANLPGQSVIFRMTGPYQSEQIYYDGPLQNLVLNGSNGSDTFNVQGLPPSPTALAVYGGTGPNTLVGPNINNNWTVTGINSGNLDQVVSFAAVQNLVGGTGVDVFKFLPGNPISSSLGGSVSSVNGGGAPAGMGDWLDYSAWTTPVTVNLATGAATNINGGAAGAVTNIQDVHGGNGGNTLIGDAQGNILIGGSGADTITGGTGLSLLIGDGGSDTVTGGSGGSASGGDILIGGYTIYDTMTTANETALMAILAEWQSTDSYATRFSKINNGLPGGYALRYGTTVKDDGQVNTLTAAASSGSTPLVDWFFASNLDILVNFETGEHKNNT